MKKKIGIIIGIIVLLALIGISFFINPKEEENLETDPEVILANAKKESEEIQKEEQKEFVEITVDDYLEYYQESDKTLVLIGRTGCQYCQIAEPIIRNLSYQYDLTIYYLNLDNFKEEDKSKLLNSNEVFQSNFGTPLFLLVGNNSIIDKVDGLTDKAHYKTFFKMNELI